METHFAEDYFRYDEIKNIVNIWFFEADSVILERRRFLFADGPFRLPYDLDSGIEIQHEPRLKSLGALKNAIDPFKDNLGVAFESSTTISLNNEDRYFDDIYNKWIWLNQQMKVYSWSPELDNFTDALQLFDGIITNPDFSNNQVKFSGTNFAYKLRSLIGLPVFSDADGSITDSTRNKPKRLLYGRTDGVKCTTVDALNNGYQFSGTISGSESSPNITASAGLLDELDIGAKIKFTIDEVDYEFSVEDITSDTEFVLSEDLTVGLTDQAIIIEPDRPNYHTNRDWHVGIGKLFDISTTITSVVDARIFEIGNVTDLRVGDVVIYQKDTPGETHRTISQINGNTIFLNQALGSLPTLGQTINKIPLFRVFSGNTEYRYQRTGTDRDFNFTNNSSDCIVHFEPDAELKATLPQNLTGTIVSASSRSLEVSGGNFTSQLRSRDWIRMKNNNNDIGYYQVLKVVDNNNLEIRDSGFSVHWLAGESLERKVVDYLQDDSFVGVDTYGIEDSDGNWLKYPAMAVKDLLSRVGVTNIDQSSFDDVNEQLYFTTSLKLPLDSLASEPDARTAIGYLNQSFMMSLFEKNGLVTVDIINGDRPAVNSLPITDFDAIGNVDIKTDTDIFREVRLNHNHFDISTNSNESGFDTTNSDPTVVQQNNGVTTTKTVECYMYDTGFAQILANRYNFFHVRSQQVFTIKGKLNLVDYNVHDRVIIDLDRNPNKVGQADNKYKVLLVVETIRDGKNVTLKLNDLSDWLSVCCPISESDQPDYDATDDKQKAINGHITSNDHSLCNAANDDDETFEINRIM